MDCVEIYLKQIGRYPLLSKEEEVALFKQFKRGDASAKNKLINSNLRLVVNVVKKFNSRLHILDLIAEGNLGLIRAVETFKPELRNRFSTYAVLLIRDKIIDLTSSKCSIVNRPTCTAKKIDPIIYKYKDAYYKKHGYLPNIDEINIEVNNRLGENINRDMLISLIQSKECFADVEHVSSSLESDTGIYLSDIKNTLERTINSIGLKDKMVNTIKAIIKYDGFKDTVIAESINVKPATLFERKSKVFKLLKNNKTMQMLYKEMF